jgi:hypothetical protein
VKDQYFGDVNDYRKYGLLRAILASTGVRLGVCWMLTAPDSRKDGRHLGYLDKPKKFRAFDDELFDWLRRTIHQFSDRRTARIEVTDLLPRAVYFSEVLVDGNQHRKTWLANCRRQLDGCDLVFFDPDNGLERSVSPGRRNSHKFLYWAEVRDTFSAGVSVLVYQHFPREARASYIEHLAERLRDETQASAVFSFVTPHVLFLLAAQERQAEPFREVVRRLPHRWPEKEIMAREMHPTLATPSQESPFSPERLTIQLSI